MTTKTPTAGDRLCADLTAAPACVSQEVGRELELDEAECHIIAQAAAAADRTEQMAALYAAELVREPEPRLRNVIALPAEMRLCEEAAVDLVARVRLGFGAANSPRHVRAANTRWQGQPKRPLEPGVMARPVATNPRPAGLYAWLLDRTKPPR